MTIKNIISFMLVMFSFTFSYAESFDYIKKKYYRLITINSLKNKKISSSDEDLESRKYRQISELEHIYDEQVFILKDTFDQHISELKNGHNKRISELKEKGTNNEQISQLENRYDKEILPLIDMYDRKISELYNMYDKDISNIELKRDKQISKLKYIHDEQISKLKEKDDYITNEPKPVASNDNLIDKAMDDRSNLGKELKDQKGKVKTNPNLETDRNFVKDKKDNPDVSFKTNSLVKHDVNDEL